ncbi:MAG: organomercurial lyase [Candidatus Thorarchaeota archaeon]
MTTDTQLKLINNRVVSDFLDLHLEVLGCVLKGMTFDEIQVKFSRLFKQLNYVEIAHFSSLLSFDDEGTLRGAYPFSPFETEHRITVEGIGSGYAMCAIDSLGVAGLFGARTVIQSKDALTRAPLEVTVDPVGIDAGSYSDIFVVAPKGIPAKGEDEMYDSAVDSCPFVGFLIDVESIPEEMTSSVTVIPLDQATDYAKTIFSGSAFAEQLRAAIYPLLEICESGSLPVESVVKGVLKRQTNPRLRAAPEKEAKRLVMNDLLGKGVVQQDDGKERNTECLTLTNKGFRIVKIFLTELECMSAK